MSAGRYQDDMSIIAFVFLNLNDLLGGQVVALQLRSLGFGRILYTAGMYKQMDHGVYKDGAIVTVRPADRAGVASMKSFLDLMDSSFVKQFDIGINLGFFTVCGLAGPSQLCVDPGIHINITEMNLLGLVTVERAQFDIDIVTFLTKVQAPWQK
jgi:hypothetical protein